MITPIGSETTGLVVTYVYCGLCGQSYPQGHYHLCPMNPDQSYQQKCIYTTRISASPSIEDLLERIAIALEKIADGLRR